MVDSYLASGGRSDRLKEMIKAGDREGIERMRFGEIVYYFRNRRTCGLSQGQAAEIAGIERTEWNRIENGLVRPLSATVDGMAKALDVEPAILFVLAGHKVPEEHCLYDREYMHQKLDQALDLCHSRAEFLIYMDSLWKECEEILMIAELGKLPRQVPYRPTYSELMANALEHLTIGERVQFALALVESPLHSVGHAVERAFKDMGVDQAHFYKMINDRLEELRCPMPTLGVDDPL